MSIIALAPLFSWGEWVELENNVGFSYTVSFKSTSLTPSLFDVEIQYATNRGYRTEYTTGPGSYTIKGYSGSVGRDRIRFKSRSTGQKVEVTY
ncbi:colicin Z C-terminal domain-related protein [Xenorhabdus innexi]|uniref:Uncharacterized protein n=1 Tax=Xenorhabdus innexi TaxID=290109 RepID=A0A1N6N0Y0_9GAMM|nr:colicin Z C-terminal domain-related protein [Xenorhabdus innexi]PHM28342.1 hypothetical protein Xinn_03847 [Xenorhabdus innexi]SIP74699.1 conserved hypothetical protein [Xenorhabdus innexi]